MKFFLAILLSFFTLPPVFSQDTVVSYFDKDWKTCAQSDALYIRKTLKCATDSTPVYRVWDYFLSGKLQMVGVFSDDSLKTEEGLFVYYYESGIVSERSEHINGKKQGKNIEYFRDGSVKYDDSYVDGKLDGHSKTFYEDGTISIDKHFVLGKLEGSTTYHFKNGQIAYKAEYQSDTLLSYQLFKENGLPEDPSLKPLRMAEFPGGKEGLQQYLTSEIKFPTAAKKRRIDGRVYLKFIVNTDGQVTAVEVVKGIPNCPECAAEAVRVIKAMPKWEPARDNNVPVKSYYNVPMRFKNR